MYNPAEYTIDKSLFTAEELAQYEALVAKATVDPEANKEKLEEEDPPVVPPKKKPAKKAEEEEPVIEKSAEQSPEITYSLADFHCDLYLCYDDSKFLGRYKILFVA